MSNERNEPMDEPQLEISVDASRELVDIGLAVLLDIRQSFELELEGAVDGAVSVPLFRLKQLLGKHLSEEEQELLDADEPDERDFQHFLSLINQHHVRQDQILLCLCNSGRRSLRAAQLLRDLGYARSLSVREGFRGWQERGNAD